MVKQTISDLTQRSVLFWRATLGRPGGTFLPVAGSLILFAIVKLVLTRLPAAWGIGGIALAAIALALCGLAAIRIRTAELAPATCLMVRGITILFTAFIVAAPVSVPAAGLQAAGISAWIFHDGRWLAIGVAAVAWFRPSLSLVNLAHVWAGKNLYQSITGLPITRTDWTVVWEAGVFLVIACWVAERWRAYLGLDETARARAEEGAVLVVVAAHFSNYLYSGLGKLALGPAPWTWLLENPTDVLILTSWHMGLLPLAVSSELAVSAYKISHAVPLLINAGTVFAQLLTLVAMLRIAWQRWLLAYFELQHATIFLLTGIFFWKWIVLNLLLITALGRIRHLRLAAGTARSLLALMIAAPLLFHVVRLAWYDTGVLNDARPVAVTQDGRDIELATNAALYGSVTFTQSRAGQPLGGAAVTDSLGATWDAEEMRAFRHCERSDFAVGKPWRRKGDGPDTGALRRVLSETVGYIAEHPFLAQDLSRVHLYAHHVFSNPWQYPEMKGLRLDEIVAVDFAVTTRCVGLDDNGLTSIVLADGRWRILDEKDLEALR